MKNALIIFAKYPEPGKVKTRLAKTIGNVNASKLYELFVPLIIKRTKSDNYQTIVFFDPGEKHEQVKKWLNGEVNLFAQSSGALGERLKTAFAQIFSLGSEKVVVIGSDSPLLDQAMIDQAFFALDKSDCVIGPSSDGGYYLLGIKKPAPELFDLNVWSTNLVFVKTKQKAMKLNYKLSILDEHFDIDEKEDLLFLNNKLKSANYSSDGDLNKLRDFISNMLKSS
ncbi:MAG: TIGR04282 family arsenosugar biosynthesis glycosyltransferase [Candidatus Omnitrophica bacterium]|nr:TIGR04282 family arsenosugar biosynthesis glycosyltransferase [Candidatus Omnitrophota bacterium]